jgi:hypothetical protein
MTLTICFDGKLASLVKDDCYPSCRGALKGTHEYLPQDESKIVEKEFHRWSQIDAGGSPVTGQFTQNASSLGPQAEAPRDYSPGSMQVLIQPWWVKNEHSSALGVS